MARRVTIKDIANRTGVSVTTVAKALNDKPKIGDDTRKTILEVAAEMSYRPNRSAKAMASNAIRIGVAYCRLPLEFQSYFEQGLQRGAIELADFRVEVHTRVYDTINSIGQIKDILSEFSSQNLNGVVFVTGSNYAAYKEQMHRLKEMGIPVLLLISELEDPAVIGTIELNARITGGMAAQFLHLVVPERRPVAIFVANKDMSVHVSCAEGFSAMARSLGLPVCGIYETNDDRDIAYYLTNRVFSEWPDLAGLYISSYNSVGVCQWLEDNGRQGEIKVIGQDLYPALVEKLLSGTLTATLFQNQFEIGRRGLAYMYEYLVGARKREDCSKLITPQLVMMSNLECYKDYY